MKGKTKRSTLIWVGLLTFIIGSALLVFFGINLMSYLEKEETYVPTTGVVVGFDSKYVFRTDSGYVAFAPIVEYVVDGKTYSAVHKIYSNLPSYYIGETIELIYNPNDPEDVLFNFWSSHWIELVIGIGFAGLGLIVTFGGLFRYKKYANSQ